MSEFDFSSQEEWRDDERKGNKESRQGSSKVAGKYRRGQVRGHRERKQGHKPRNVLEKQTRKQ